MSDKIEVCGKLCVIARVYKLRFTDTDNSIFGYVYDNGVFDASGVLIGRIGFIADIYPINGEVLEDAPWEPKNGDVCVFSDDEDFKWPAIVRFNDMRGEDIFLDYYGNAYAFYKPLDLDNPPWSE